MDPLAQLRKQKENAGAKNKAISEIVTPDKLKVDFGDFAPGREAEAKRKRTAKTAILVVVAALLIATVVIISILLL